MATDINLGETAMTEGQTYRIDGYANATTMKTKSVTVTVTKAFEHGGDAVVLGRTPSGAAIMLREITPGQWAGRYARRRGNRVGARAILNGTPVAA